MRRVYVKRMCDLCNNATHYTMDNVDGDKLMDAVPKEEVIKSF